MNNHAVTDRAGLIRIVKFRVKPDKQARLADLLEEAIEKWVKPLPGFLSAHILRSADGMQVINLARWATEADWLAMENDPKVGPAFAVPFRLALETHLRSYRISGFVEGTDADTDLSNWVGSSDAKG